ncbi:hypothetical protein [Pseudomonas sp. MWU12-2323]|uniref:hypothetical protein n=1 Tax=Pseudomonas sp. MWU12-2323 TaxID=2651296 RepID=UPI00128B5354|nr:hypothetical protein [Pseudomonas sp. MWU12-2323]MPQ69480.1 hypothetical protein [Pseudomonas sp. MWU12-2323]
MTSKATNVATRFPHAAKYFAESWVCPCCGQGDELNADVTLNYGTEVFEKVSCPKCFGEWKNEYRLHAIRHNETGDVVLNPSQPLAALQALAAASWLDEAPYDSDELTAAKRQARDAMAMAVRAS